MTECRHETIMTFSNEDGSVRLWACDSCKRRFYPACPTCVDVGHRNIEHPDGATLVDRLRDEFVRLLTTDSETKDRRRREFNQAIFNAEGGWAVWSSTDLGMVMEKFYKAAREVGR